MTYSDFDGYIELNTHEMMRLKSGEKFLTVIRPATKNNITKCGSPGDTLGARETDSLSPQYNVKVVSNFLTNGQWITVLARLVNGV